MYITQGKGVVWVDGKEYPIEEGDFVLVPPNSLHHFKNTTKTTLTRITFNPKESEPFL